MQATEQTVMAQMVAVLEIIMSLNTLQIQINNCCRVVPVMEKDGCGQQM